MDCCLLLAYILTLTVVIFITIGLSRLKKALLRLSRKLQKRPPSIL